MGCTLYTIRVNGFSNSDLATFQEGASFYVHENSEAKNPILEKEVRGKIETLLKEEGFTVEPIQDADYIILVSYGIDNAGTRTVSMPIYSPGGTATVSTYDSYGYSYSFVQMPGSTNYVPISRRQHFRWLDINVLDGQKFRKSQNTEPVWIQEIRSTGSSSDLRNVINYLLVASFQYFGIDTKNQKKVELFRGDSRVKKIGGN
jgi:hypothetical protein